MPCLDEPKRTEQNLMATNPAQTKAKKLKAPPVTKVKMGARKPSTLSEEAQGKALAGLVSGTKVLGSRAERLAEALASAGEKPIITSTDWDRNSVASNPRTGKAGTNNFDALRLIQEKNWLTPLEFMLKVMNDDSVPRPDRMDAAKGAAPYIHSKLQSVVLESSNDKLDQEVKEAYRDVLRQMADTGPPPPAEH